MPDPEHERPREREPQPFSLAAQYLNERPGLRAYEQAQEAIYKAPACDLSVYRLLLPSVHAWLVTVIGEQPDEQLERRLRSVLATGIPASVPPDVLGMLQQRRAAATKLAPWVEGHYPPQTQN